MGIEVLGEAVLGLRPVCLCCHLVLPAMSDLATASSTAAV